MSTNALAFLAAHIKKDPAFVAVGPFRSSSGTIVPFYLEFRRLYSDPLAMKHLVRYAVMLVQKIKPQVVAGAETAGIPLAMAVSLKTGIPFVYIKKQRKTFLTRTA